MEHIFYAVLFVAIAICAGLLKRQKEKRMSQHDMDITTADANVFVDYRAAVNAALKALASSNSGATEPATPYAYQVWADTASGILKQRNAANTGWVSLFTLATGPLESPTFTGSPVLPIGTSIGNVSATELQYLNGVSQAIQTQFDQKVNLEWPENPVIVDASTDALTLTSQSLTLVRTGYLISYAGSVQYPTTALTGEAKVKFPYMNEGMHVRVKPCTTLSIGVIFAIISVSPTEITLTFKAANGTPLTNAQLSGQIVTF